MTTPDERQLNALEAALRAFVRDELSRVSYEFTRSVRGSTELVAASFSVSAIGQMWRRRVPGVFRRILGVARAGADNTAGGLGVSGDVPPDWNRPGQVPDRLTQWADATRARLNGIGDRLAAEAVHELDEGIALGESQNQLEARMVSAFNRNSHNMGSDRAQRIAATESISAWNAGAMGVALAVADASGRHFTKTWVSRHDDKVRSSHQEADGQRKALQLPFHVGGELLQFPGDPTASAGQVINCRCVLRIEARQSQQASAGIVAPMTTHRDKAFDAEVQALQSRMPQQLKDYWLYGPGAAKIGWGTPGSFRRCVKELKGKFPKDTEGLCANLYHEATGRWPGRKKSGAGVNADGTVHTGAMLALLPSEADAARIALDGGEAADQLHVTLAYLGEASDWASGQRDEFTSLAAGAAMRHAPIAARMFGAAQWNPASDTPSWVWNVGDDGEAQSTTGLAEFRSDALSAVDGFQLPKQHSPWVAHMCAAYGQEADFASLVDRLGPITLDRLVVAFGGEWTVFDLNGNPMSGESMADTAPPADGPVTATWYTPGDTALAFENQQTGDGRIFAPGALYWDGNGPWPLMANDEFDGHNDAALAGAITHYGREGDRITGEGVLYLTQDVGEEAAMLLAQGAPLGVSVDLDDVSVEVVMTEPGGAPATQPGGMPVPPYRANLLWASVLPTADGGFRLRGELTPTFTASADTTAMVTESVKVSFLVGPGGHIPRSAFEIQAAAGDPDSSAGTVVDSQSSGDCLMRITRARVRGATLVTIPAFAGARIVLDNPQLIPGWGPGGAPAAQAVDTVSAALKSETDYERVLRHVRRSKSPVGPARVAQYLKMPITAAQRLLALAASRGEAVRLTKGLYTDATTSARADHVMMDDMLAAGGPGDVLTAASTGSVDLPVAPRDHAWDGAGAEKRMFDHANGSWSEYGKGFAWKDDRADPQTKGAFHLPYCDIINGTLTIIPRGVFAAQAALSGSRGGVAIPADQKGAVVSKLEKVRVHVEEVTGQQGKQKMEASAWSAIKDLPPMPADWFTEPTREELATDMGGVHYANGRIFGWVARAGEPHAGFAKKITVESLGRIDTTHFLRQRFTLDDGSTVRAGALTMNTGHHRDGAECETASCAFDDTRTVAGIVTVGMNERGMWFSGAAHPTLSEWDRRVFMACEPSYHMTRGGNGAWQLRGVLTVPVPGHSTPMVASLVASVVERNNLALTAAASYTSQVEEIEEVVAREEARQADVTLGSLDYDRLADALVASMSRARQREADEAAELAALLSEGQSLTASAYDDGATETHQEEA